MPSPSPAPSGPQQQQQPQPQPEIPWAFIDCPTDTLIILISHMLNLLIQHNDQVVLTPDALTRFHSRAAPGISVIEYLRRIVKYTNMEKIPLLSLLAYIDITCQHLPTFTLSSLTVHRFLIAGVCAGSKAQCDVFCTNAHYAKVGGIKTGELNALEREFLKVTHWDLCCNSDLLQRYYTSLIKSHGEYTQAAEPASAPFVPFPRSRSKPRATSSSETLDEDMPEQANQSEDEGTGEAPESTGRAARRLSAQSTSSPSAKRKSVDVSEMIVDQVAEATSPIINRGRGSRRSSMRQQSASRSRMEVDVPPPTAEVGVTALTAETGDDPETSPYSAASTGSIPSSGRSSVRGGRTPGRGRAVSLSYSDPKIAEPRVDRTIANGQGADWRDTSAVDDSTDQHQHDAHDHHHHHHTLKSLVGGIFRRKSHNHDKPPPPDPPRPPSVPAAQTNGTPHHSSSHVPRTAAPTPARGTSTSPTVTKSPRVLQSPGLAKAVTPRIRTRDEISVDHVNGHQPLVSPVADDGKRRARVE